jgi:hypothetical protein
MSTSAVALTPPLDDDPSHAIRVGSGDKLDCDVTAARKIAMKKTFCGTAVLGADVSAERFLLHWYLRRHGTGSGHLRYISRLRPLLPLYDLELYLIAFGKRLEAAALNRAVVNEDVRPTLTGNEPEPFRVVEPLHGAGDASH